MRLLRMTGLVLCVGGAGVPALADDGSGGAECSVRISAIVGPQQTRIEAVDDLGAAEHALEPGEAALPEDFAEPLARDGACRGIEVVRGATSRRIADAVAALFPDGEAVADVPEEGRLAPGSYEVGPDMTAADVLAEMQARQDEILDRAWSDRADDLPIASKDEALTLASLVAAEALDDDEADDIAAVLVNRLREDMKLQTDPAVIYGASDGLGILEGGLTKDDLQTETPWNTYMIEGLPESPISNPSEADIEAALNPAGGDMLFFVADGAGGHRFSATLEEHEANIRALQETAAAE